MLSTIEAIYAAASDKVGWDGVLTRIADLVDATAAQVIHHSHPDRVGVIRAGIRTDPDAVAAYQAHYHRVDPGRRPR